MKPVQVAAMQFSVSLTLKQMRKLLRMVDTWTVLRWLEEGGIRGAYDLTWRLGETVNIPKELL